MNDNGYYYEDLVGGVKGRRRRSKSSRKTSRSDKTISELSRLQSKKRSSLKKRSRPLKKRSRVDKTLRELSKPSIQKKGPKRSIPRLYYGIEEVPKGRKLASAIQAVQHGQVRYYGTHYVSPEDIKSMKQSLAASKETHKEAKLTVRELYDKILYQEGQMNDILEIINNITAVYSSEKARSSEIPPESSEEEEEVRKLPPPISYAQSQKEESENIPVWYPPPVKEEEKKAEINLLLNDPGIQGAINDAINKGENPNDIAAEIQDNINEFHSGNTSSSTGSGFRRIRGRRYY